MKGRTRRSLKSGEPDIPEKLAEPNSHSPAGLEPTRNGHQAGRGADGRFVAGNRISPGRRQGSRNRASILAESLLSEHATQLFTHLIERALAGDGTALRLCVERLLPPAKARFLTVDLGEAETVQDVNQSFRHLLSALRRGEIDLEELRALADVLERQTLLLEVADVEERLLALEQAVATGGADE